MQGCCSYTQLLNPFLSNSATTLSVQDNDDWHASSVSSPIAQERPLLIDISKNVLVNDWAKSAIPKSKLLSTEGKHSKI